MITEIKTDQLWHDDINNENAVEAPSEGKDWRFVKISNSVYIDLTQEEIDQVLIDEAAKAKEIERSLSDIKVGSNWSMGVDVDDDGKFKVCNNPILGTTPRYIADTHGNFRIGNGIIGSIPPFSMTFHANYNTVIDGSLGDGDLTGTAGGSPTPTINDGLLDLTGGTANYISYDADLNADSQQTGTIRLLWIPNYTGNPSTNTTLFNISEANSDLTNSIKILHLTTGVLRLLIYSSTNSVILSHIVAWTGQAGQEYELELNYDLTSGATRLFVDGTILGVVQTATGTRSSTIGLLRVGSDESGVQTSDFKVNNITIYNSVQHTSNYTPTSPEFEPDMLALSFFGNNRTGFIQTGDSWDFYSDGIKMMKLNNNGSIEMLSQGLLPPKMTTAERDAIPSPEEGLQIYNTTTKVPEFYNGTTWGAN